MLELVLSVFFAFLFPVLVWTVWYRVAGYTDVSVAAAQLAGLALPIALVVVMRLGFGEIGLSPAKLPSALASGLIAYAAVMGVAFLVRLAGLADLQILRPHYRLDAFVSGWGSISPRGSSSARSICCPATCGSS